MRRLVPILAFAVLAAGCNMAGPGVQHLGSEMTAEQQQHTTYNSKWVNTAEPDVINTLDRKGELSTDISDRQLGVRYVMEGLALGQR